MKWLCKIGIHKWIPIFDQVLPDEWWPPSLIGHVCERCGCKAGLVSDQFDGTDGA
jgi:hypothetical protein